MTDARDRFAQALQRIYRRPERPTAWTDGGNLPWDNPDFSARMLREHLDQSHGAASRTDPERALQLAWLGDALALGPGMAVCDMTCGPGLYAVALARQGCHVTGIDFGPASVAHARGLAQKEGVADRCTIIQSDVRDVALAAAAFDAALFIYGQLAVFPREQAQALLEKLARALKPGGRLCIELLNADRVDTGDSNWWFTDDSGLWGDGPFLHMGERFWDAEQKIATERFYTLHLESGRLDEVHLSDQAYSVDEMTAMLRAAGFAQVTVHPAWDGLPLYDAAEWIVYIAER